VEIAEAVEAGTLGSKEAAKQIFELADSYEFEVPIRKDALVRARWVREEDELSERGLGRVRRGFRWALTTPHTRDLVNSSQTFFRWCAHQPDPHLLRLNASEAQPQAETLDAVGAVR
jgi:hypothetical protein